MSQAGILKISSGSLPPSVPTSFVTDSGTAIPVANILNVLGGEGIDISGAGNTVTVSGEDATAGINAGAANKGIASFDSASFSVIAGFVQLIGSATNIASVDVDVATAPGTDPVVPTAAGQITLTGSQVAPGTVGANVIRSNSLAANSITMEIQRSAAVGAPVLSSNGVCHFDSAQFTVTPSGFVSATGSIPIGFTADSGTATPAAGNLNILGGPGVTTSASGSTVTINSVVFTDTTAATLAVDNGYFATAAGTYVLPAAPAQGEVVIIVCDTAGAVVVDAPGTQLIRVGSAVTSAGGTATSTALGDGLTLRYRASNTTWHAVSVVGNWILA